MKLKLLDAGNLSGRAEEISGLGLFWEAWANYVKGSGEGDLTKNLGLTDPLGCSGERRQGGTGD